MRTVKVAAIQASSVFLDTEATLAKAVGLIEKAAAEGAEVMVFPETFLPSYPDWVWRTTPWSDAEWFKQLAQEAVVVPGPVTERLGEAAAAAGAYVAIGVTEREAEGSTVYNALLYFGPDGELLGRHRKLMPTGGERLVWGEGDGSTLTVVDTPFGRLGGLICWENYMPLARVAMYAQGIDIWVAPTWDNGDMWVATLRHIAKEGRMFVVGVAQVMRGSDVPLDLPGRDGVWRGEDDWMCRGFSTIVGPEGDVLAGPLVGEEGILYADVDASVARTSRRQFDPVGHYSRPDVFRLSVDTRPRPLVEFEE